VAAAADFATVTIGEDTGGSIRHPAAYCGTVGLRPTWGLVSRFGMIPAASELDTLGPLTRSVEDAAHVLGVIAGPDPRDPTCLPDQPPDYLAGLSGGVRGLRIGIVRELLPGPDLRADAEEAVREVARVFNRAGATLRDVSIPLAVDAGIIYTAFAEPEAARVHLATLRARPDAYYANVRIRLARGLLVPAAVAAWARDTGRRILVEQIRQAFNECDLLLAPAAPGPAPHLEEAGGVSALTTDSLLKEFALQSYRMPFSLHGGPALALCCGFSTEGLPLSVQLVAAPRGDTLVLQAGHAYQQHTTWHARHPSMPWAGPEGKAQTLS
jgi:Asp-tRNA(Asn)/Glu-tRNA(Gln) amidotransferase A subunit family amidase